LYTGHHDHHEEEDDRDCHDTCWVHVDGMDRNCEEGCGGCFDFPMGHCEPWCHEDLCVVNGCAACHGMPEDMTLDELIAHV